MNGIRANCYVHIPRGTAKAPAGSLVPAVLNVSKAELSRTILLGGAYTEGAEALAVRAAAAGWTVRFGDITAVNLQYLRNNACHGIILPADADLTEPAGIELERYPAGDSLLVMRRDLHDAQAEALRTFAGGA